MSKFNEMEIGTLYDHIENLTTMVHYSRKVNLFDYIKYKKDDKLINLGYKYTKFKKEYDDQDNTVYLIDMLVINWWNSVDEGLESLALCFREYMKEISGYDELMNGINKANLKDDSDEVVEKIEVDVEDDEEIKPVKKSGNVVRKEFSREAASDSIAKGMKNMQAKSMKNKQAQSSQNEDIPQRVTFSGFDQPQQNAASFNQPHFTNERDLWMFELGRRQVLGENYHGPLSPQQYQLAMQQYDQSEHLSTASVKNESNLPPKIVTQEEMVSCIKEYASRFPDIYGEKFVTEIMENDTCTLKGHGHDYIKMYQACHGADAVSDGKLTNRIILEIDWLYSYKEFMADIGELFVEYTLKHMPYSEKFMTTSN